MIYFISLLYGVISFLSSLVGAICGIGGGIIIKPVLDIFHLDDVTTISFLSGCSVLAMSLYSVLKQMKSNRTLIDLKSITPLAIGAAIGGIVGKQMFQSIIHFCINLNIVQMIQAGCLIILTIFTYIYNLYKHNIKTYELNNHYISFIVGCILGILSSFLGIGGGPINLVILSYIFSMNIKVAAVNSLYIILCSQCTSLLFTFITNTIPPFSLKTLIFMIIAGVLGGVVGTYMNRKMKEETVNILFSYIMIVIIVINIYNILKFI